MPNIQGLKKGYKLFASIQSHNSRYEYNQELREITILRAYTYFYLVRVGDTERKVSICKVYTQEEYLEEIKVLSFHRTAIDMFDCSGKNINDTVDRVLEEAPVLLAKIQSVLKTAQELKEKTQ